MMQSAKHLDHSDDLPRPGNFDRAWNDPPLFSYTSSTRSRTGGIKLNKRVGFPSSGTPHVAPRAGSIRGVSQLPDAGAAPSILFDSLPPPPPPPPPSSSSATPRMLKVDETEEAVEAYEDVRALLNNVLDFCEFEPRKKSAIVERLDMMETKWKSGHLNEPVMRGMTKIAKHLDAGDISEAEKVHIRLMVDWPLYCGRWFTLSQTDTHLLIRIYAPFTNVSDTEIFMEDFDFRFFSKPYFLRLHLPGKIQENDEAVASFVAEDTSFEIKAPKVNCGEHFEGLDMLTSFLMPSGTTTAGVKIETLEAPGEEDEDDIEFYFDQQIPVGNETDQQVSDNGYGFGFQEIGIFEKLLDEFQELLDVKDPDKITRNERRAKRVQMEQESFSEDHYLADFFEADEINELIKHESDFANTLKEFDKKDQELLINLPRKETLIPKNMKHSVFYGLVDILFGYCYEKRVSGFDNLPENCPEAGWTVAKLSSTLSCCDMFENLEECLHSCFRRSLIYPLHRNFQLSVTIAKDLGAILEQGKVAILKCLSEIHSVLAQSEGKYVFNQIYIEPYAVWIQKVKQGKFSKLSQLWLEGVEQLQKAHLDLDLDELERVAQLVIEEQQEVDISHILQNVHLKEEKETLDSDDSSEDSSNDSSDDSSDTESSSESNPEAEVLVGQNSPENKEGQS